MHARQTYREYLPLLKMTFSRTIKNAIDEMLQLAGQMEHASSNIQLPLSPSSNAPVQKGFLFFVVHIFIVFHTITSFD